MPSRMFLVNNNLNKNTIQTSGSLELSIRKIEMVRKKGDNHEQLKMSFCIEKE